MDRFDRQTRIRGWRQETFQDAAVAVYGRSWTGCFVVWSLANLGVGQIAWLGLPDDRTSAFANWLLADPCPIPGCSIVDYPCAIEYGPELEWALDQRGTKAILDCSEDALGCALGAQFATRRNLPFLAGTTATGGWLGTQPPARFNQAPLHATTSMLVAASMVEAVRERLCPLLQGRGARTGSLGLVTPGSNRRGNVTLIGVGGIGVYAAVLAAQAGFRLTLVDLDHVEETNLNRQGLFTGEDAAQRAPKAEAAARALRRLFPRAEVTACVARVDHEFKDRLASFKPSVVLSAVDNAATRLVLQSFGRDLGVPVIQGGTDVFAADCYCQEVNGAPLDDQMHGAMSEAAARERSQPRRHGTCAADPSYVVPGMMCGALMVHRMIQTIELYRGLGPIRWRAGELPQEQNRTACHEFNFETGDPR